jgi:hypothetical protein
MRAAHFPYLFALLLIGAACDPGGVVIQGSFASESEPCTDPPVTRVYLQGGVDTATVRDCAFRLIASDSGALVLAFADEAEEVGSMYLESVPARSRITLDRIGFDEEDLAFPAAVGLRGAEVIEINGVRAGDPHSLPRTVRIEGSVLGVDAGKGLVLVRPGYDRLPDLNVRVDSASDVRTTANLPGSLEELEFGDSVRIEGATRNGLVLATTVIVPAPPEPPERPAPSEAERGIWEELGRLLDRIGI